MFYYIANIRLPTEKAHGLQIMKTCAALAAAGTKVELVVPWRANPIKEDAFDFYRVERNFSIRRIFAVDLLWMHAVEFIIFAIQTFTFACSVVVMASSSARERDTVFYGRDESVLAPLAFISRNVFWETHVGSANLFARILEKRARGIVCITKGLADFYASRGIPNDKLLVAPDAVDLASFERISSSKDLLRAGLGLPQGVSIAAYSGSLGLYSWKGVDVFLEAARLIYDPSIRCMLVGGSDRDIQSLKERFPDDRTIFAGCVPPDAVPRYLKASDVLILPNKSGDIVSERFTSPMKLFEYMASGVPIVASDLPSIREVLSPANATLVPPNDPKALADAVAGVIHGGAPVAARAARALADVRKYTWAARAAKVLDFIRKS